MGMISTFLRYAALLLIVCATVQAQIWEEVRCERMESCECMGNTGSPDPICHFTLIVNQSHTFTRYFLDDEGNPGFGGRVMYFQTSRPEPSATSPSASPSASASPSPSPDGIPTDYPPEPNERMSCDGTNQCTDAITVDGNNFRAVITVNGRFPAPTLIVPYNAVVVVDVNNELDSESTSIHWHGMHQMNTPWMDGVEHITQCGIPPASSFRYIFRAFPAGTHWYHSHSGAQRTDGLFGALIVKESDGIKPIVQLAVGGRSFTDMPQNHTLTLIDWQPKTSLELFTQLHSGIRFYDQFTVPSPENDQRIRRTCSPDGIEVGPVNFWSGLINGRGRHREINYDQTILSVFTIPSRDQRYRFRLIGAQGLYAFRFSIDEHRLLLIATDGHFVMPEMVDFIIIHSGERYDFIPQIRDSSLTKSNYIIRAETLEVPMRCERLGPNQLYENHLAEAILHYGDEGDIPSNGQYQNIANEAESNDKWCRMNEGCVAVNCPFENFPSQYGITNCISVDKLRVLPNTVSEADPMVYTTDEDKTIFFNFGFEGDSSTSTINGRNFRFPSEPPQLTNNRPIPSACNDNIRCSERINRLVTEECRCTHVRRIDPDQTYRFVFTAVGPTGVPPEPGADDPYIANWNFSHPVHLHGHSFRVTKIGFGSYNEDVDDNNYGQIIESSADINCGRSDPPEYCTTPTWTADPERMLRDDTITDAPYKDTVLVPAGGYAIVYFRSNNPGYWFLHCHIETHQLEGMAVVINEAPERHNAPPKDIVQCQPFTWSVFDFLNRERSPSRALQLPYIEYNTLFILFTISAGIGGAFIVLCVILLVISIIVYVTRCCYCCRCCCCKKESSQNQS